MIPHHPVQITPDWNKRKILKGGFTMEKLDVIAILCEEISMLHEWNKSNVNEDPEQVRKNAETILNLVAQY